MNLIEFIESLEATNIQPEQIIAAVKAYELQRVTKKRQQTALRVTKHRAKKIQPPIRDEKQTW